MPGKKPYTKKAFLDAFERKLLLSFLLIITVLFLIFYSMGKTTSAQKDAEAWIMHTKDVLQQGEKVNLHFKEVENQGRGYMITGIEDFNDSFVLQIQKLRQEIETLRELTKDNPSQQKRVQIIIDLSEKKINFAQSLVRLRREKGFDTARQKMISLEGVKLAREFNLTINEIQNVETYLLEQRIGFNELTSRRTNQLVQLLQLALGSVLLGMLIIVIITSRARQKALAALSENREWFRKTLSGIGDGVIATDEKGHVTFMNPVAEELTGWQQSDANGKKLEEIFAIFNEYSGKPVENPVKKVLETETIVELENHTVLRRRDGTEIAIGDSAAPIFTAEEKLIGTVLVFRNMEKERLNSKILESEVTRRTAEAMRAEAKFRHTLDNMLEGAQIIDEQFRYIYVNNSLVKHAQYSREELLGNKMTEKYPGIENTLLFQKIQNCMKTGEPAHLENEFTFPNGSKGYFELSVQKVPEGIFILSIDISERKKAETALKKLTDDLEKKVQERTAQLQAVNAELESFSYSVSHDLRAPLRAIDGYTKILSEDYSAVVDDEGKRIMKVISGNARQMGQLIDDLLTFSRVSKHDLVKGNVDMDVLFKSVLEEQRAANRNRKIITHMQPLPVVHGDNNMLKQVITNLLSNAVKYSAGKEEVEIEIGSFEDKGETAFFVKDKGAGFNMDYYDKLFGVFQRLHGKEFEGTGVGLALVQRIIVKHGGRVWAEGKENEGATFYFSLPK